VCSSQKEIINYEDFRNVEISDAFQRLVVTERSEENK